MSGGRVSKVAVATPCGGTRRLVTSGCVPLGPSPVPQRRTPTRRRRHWVVVACMVCIAPGCAFSLLRPPEIGSLRYRDAVFGAVARSLDVTYGSAIDEHGQTTALTLDVYSPVGDTNTSRPAIVWVHGGSFAGGDKTSSEI